LKSRVTSMLPSSLPSHLPLPTSAPHPVSLVVSFQHAAANSAREADAKILEQDKCLKHLSLSCIGGVALLKFVHRQGRRRRAHLVLRGLGIDKASFFAELEQAAETDPEEFDDDRGHEGVDGKLIFSPTTLSNYMYSPFATWMDRLKRECPDDPRCATWEEDTVRSFLFKRGNEVEVMLLDFFRRERPEMKIVDLTNARNEALAKGPKDNWRAVAAAKTTAILKSGKADLLYQAPLYHPGLGLYGIADFILRWVGEDGVVRYDIWDTKLALHPRPSFLAQLAGYAEALELQLHGCGKVDRIGLVLGEERAMNGAVVSVDADKVRPSFRKLWAQFMMFQQAFEPEDEPPDPVEGDKMSLGSWKSYANQLLTKKDDLSLVAGMTRLQRRKLMKSMVKTMKDLAKLDHEKLLELSKSLGINKATLEKNNLQAQMQVKSKEQKNPASKTLPAAHDILAKLPKDDPGDIFLDLEGMPLKKPGGAREYLIGAMARDGSFYDWWSTTEVEEKKSFRSVISWITERRRAHPGMHVYHYGHYDASAFKRVLQAWRSPRMVQPGQELLNEVFVDLFPVVKKSVVLGMPGYGLKNVERMYKPARETEVANAMSSVLVYQSWLDEPDGCDWHSSAKLSQIREYNKEDCESTMKLLRWIRRRLATVKARDCVPGKEKKAAKKRGRYLKREMAKALKHLAQKANTVPEGLLPYFRKARFKISPGKRQTPRTEEMVAESGLDDESFPRVEMDDESFPRVEMDDESFPQVQMDEESFPGWDMDAEALWQEQEEELINTCIHDIPAA